MIGNEPHQAMSWITAKDWIDEGPQGRHVPEGHPFNLHRLPVASVGRSRLPDVWG